MTPIRRNRGLLAAPEQAALNWLVGRLPSWVTPDQLSALGVAGASLAAIGFAFALSSRLFLLLSLAGLAMNWFGDSLDGKLARERGIERKTAGFMLDNGLDMVSYLTIAIGFAVSGTINPVLPFLLLSLYMMISNLALARLTVTGIFDLSMGNIGTTEIRVIFCFLAIVMTIISDQAILGSVILQLSFIDIISIFWALMMALGFLRMLWSDIGHD